MKSEYELPKSDKRYRLGNIAIDKKGRYRGHPETVSPKYLEVPKTAPISMQMNPPLVVSRELAEHLGDMKYEG